MMNAAFDSVAETYDETFTHTTLGRWFRAAVWEYLSDCFSYGDLVLELGCGTGEDAVWLASQGIAVHATDVSPRMLEIVRKKSTSQRLEQRIAVSRLDASEIGEKSPPPGPEAVGLDSATGLYDGVLANFGVLNCLDEWKSVARGLAEVVRTGGFVVVVVMGPLCPWEWVWFLSRGAPGRAFRRLQGVRPASIGEDVKIRVRYPSPGTMKRSFAPYFVPHMTAGLGVLLPPSYVSRFVERRKKWFERLIPWDRRFGRSFPGTWLNDHYLMALRRRKTESRA